MAGRFVLVDEAPYQLALERAREYESDTSVEATALRAIGVCYAELKQIEEARTHLKESLELEPGNEFAKRKLAQLRKLEVR